MKENKLSLPEIHHKKHKQSPFELQIQNNYEERIKWAKESFTDSFRLYDRELTDYPLAIDFYAGRFCVQYFANSREHDSPPPALKEDTVHTLCNLFGNKPDAIYWRTRTKSKETRQYEKKDTQGAFFTVFEHGIRFKINLTDYLDSGLFLDHRETRKMIAALAKGKRLLNLFAYTCSFSVHAALAGAVFTKSVDLSNTYTKWGEDNLSLNGIPLRNHPVIRADCLKFLKEETRSGRKYDLIVIDPPTISRSKKMDQLFDVQKDYPFLITTSLALLDKEGSIFFSTNSRKFQFANELFPNCCIEEITERTIPQDFHDKGIHRCWKISKIKF
jgi:23S rRNA (cytosine1962-C5)-methyltransferase